MFPFLLALSLTLAPPVARVTLSAPRDTVSPGDTLRVTASVIGTNGKAVTTPVGWGLSAPAVARFVAPTTTAKTAYVIALAPGAVAVDATAGGVSGTRTVIVRAVPPAPGPTPNAAPVARFTGLCALLACSVDGRGSSDDHGIARYTWTFGDSGAVTIDGATAAYTWSAPGTYRVTLRVVDSAGLTATLTQTLTATAPPVQPPVVTVDTSGTVVVVAVDTTRTPTLPRRLDTTAPAITGRTLVVSATGNLQAALDSARTGDVITLANGATYTGNFVLPVKAGSTPTSGGWITIRSADTTALPPPGTRLVPATLARPLARLATPNTMPVLGTAPGAAGYRVTGVELTAGDTVTTTYGLVALGSGLETALAQYPGRITFDRVWLHGRATLNTKRCAALNAIAVAVIDSYVSDCRAKIGAFDETQGLLAWNGPGPFAIRNNYVEAGGVSLMFGGAADPNIPGVIPSDIEITRNYVVKPLAWKGLVTNKNAIEFKDAQRVLIEGNVVDHNWADAQSGWLVQMTAVSQSNTADWITVRDVTIRRNVFRDSPQGINLVSRYAQPGGLTLREPTRRVWIEQNSLEAIGPGNLLQLNGDLDRVTIARNTATASVNAFLYLLGGSGPQTGLVVQNNVFPMGLYGLFGDNVGTGTAALTAYAPGAVFAGNALVGSNWYPSTYPSATTWLLPGAPLPAGVGADPAVVQAATAGVVIP